MELRLMTCTDDNRVINKNPVDINTVECSVYGECSMFEPTLLLSYFRGMENCNYCYIPEWNRYYFVVNSTFRKGMQVVLRCRCDVLMSFKPYIEDLTCHISSTSTRDASGVYLADPNMPVSSDSFVINVPFSESPFDRSGSEGGSYVLTVVGGGD